MLDKKKGKKQDTGRIDNYRGSYYFNGASTQLTWLRWLSSRNVSGMALKGQSPGGQTLGPDYSRRPQGGKQRYPLGAK